MQLVPKEVLLLPPPTSCTDLVWAFGKLTLLVQLDKLVISQLGFLAQRRLARGVKLNHAEACVCSLNVGRWGSANAP